MNYPVSPVSSKGPSPGLHEGHFLADKVFFMDSWRNPKTHNNVLN